MWVVCLWMNDTDGESHTWAARFCGFPCLYACVTLSYYQRREPKSHLPTRVSYNIPPRSSEHIQTKVLHTDYSAGVSPGVIGCRPHSCHSERSRKVLRVLNRRGPSPPPPPRPLKFLLSPCPLAGEFRHNMGPPPLPPAPHPRPQTVIPSPCPTAGVLRRGRAGQCF